MKCVIFGASGYGGAELLRVLSGHPDFEVVAVGGRSAKGMKVRDLYPASSSAIGELAFLDTVELMEVIKSESVPLVFLALPHGESQRLVPELLEITSHIIDLAADFRIKDPAQYEYWYGHRHSCPKLLDQAVYGLPELDRSLLKGARLVAVPGCYPTASTLAMAPLIKSGYTKGKVVVDAASGVSGAGRSLRLESLAMSVMEEYRAYSLRTHRHTVEIENNLGVKAVFTPHLVPMKRGILATCYLEPSGSSLKEFSGMSQDDIDGRLLELYESFYDLEPFVKLSSTPPGTASVYGSNNVSISVAFDKRTETFIALGAIDNLTKGAAGQGVQCANLVVGFAEDSGLTQVGVWP